MLRKVNTFGGPPESNSCAADDAPTTIHTCRISRSHQTGHHKTCAIILMFLNIPVRLLGCQILEWRRYLEISSSERRSVPLQWTCVFNVVHFYRFEFRAPPLFDAMNKKMVSGTTNRFVPPSTAGLHPYSVYLQQEDVAQDQRPLEIRPLEIRVTETKLVHLPTRPETHNPREPACALVDLRAVDKYIRKSRKHTELSSNLETQHSNGEQDKTWYCKLQKKLEASVSTRF